MVNADHQHPVGQLQPLPIHEWKWEMFTLDLITKLPKAQKKHESIMVVVDKLTKISHFIRVKSAYKVVEIIDIFMKEIFELHGMSKVVISDRDVKFTSAFQNVVFRGPGTWIQFSTTYQPRTDGQTMQFNQVLEDMLRIYVMQQTTKWEDYLLLVEFTYNKNYHESLQISPYEMLYGRRCRTPAGWHKLKDKMILRPKMLKQKWNKN